MNLPRPSHKMLHHAAPSAPSRFTPWALAVASVGRSIYGDEWDNAETALSDFTALDRAKIIEAQLKQENPELAKRQEDRRHWDSAWRSRSPHRKPEEIERERLLREQLTADLTPVLSAISDRLPSLPEQKRQNDERLVRLAAAKAALAAAILDSRVSGFWHKEGGGSLPAPLQLGRFMSANAGNQFALYVRGLIQIDGANWHIYVDAAQLEAAFPLAPRVSAPAGMDEAALSDYMRLALHVASLGYGANFDGEKKEIVRELFKSAPAFGLGDGKLSDPVAGHIATILRNIDRQAGKAGRKNSKPVH